MVNHPKSITRARRASRKVLRCLFGRATPDGDRVVWAASSGAEGASPGPNQPDIWPAVHPRGPRNPKRRRSGWPLIELVAATRMRRGSSPRLTRRQGRAPRRAQAARTRRPAADSGGDAGPAKPPSASPARIAGPGLGAMVREHVRLRADAEASP